MGCRGCARLGVFLESRGIAQVAMNLLDYRVTPPAVVAERVDVEARARGVAVSQWELVGCAPSGRRISATLAPLIPNACLIEAALFRA